MMQLLMVAFLEKVLVRVPEFKSPEAHTDYIISVISEEFGAIIVIGILFLYLIFSYRVFKKINFLKKIYQNLS